MKRALVVDDSPVIRKIATRVLERLEFDVGEAVDGQAALDLCLAQMPDLILLDWNMPVLDGFGFLRELRKAPDGRSPCVLLCTTENDVAHIARAMHAGANGYMMKPFNQEILQAKVKEFGFD